MTDILNEAREQVLTEGRGLDQDQVLRCLRLPASQLAEALSLAHQVRMRWCGPEVEVEGIVSVKTGGCPEDCHFCSQSGQFSSPVRSVWLDIPELVEAAKATAATGATEFCIVAAVRGPDQRLMSQVATAVRAITEEVGIHVAATAARTLKRVHLELGGKNAIIVMDDANLENAAEGILWSAFGTSGQRCTAASRVIVHERVYDRLAAILVERAEGLRIGDGLDPSVQIGPLINAAALEKVHRYTGIGRDEGATILTGGEPVTDAGEGYFYRPTIFGDVERDMRVATEEIFGPATSLIRCRDLDDAIAISNRVEYGLSSAIYTDRIDDAFRAIRDLDTGITYINAGTIGAEIQLPFGGTKYTGNGHREAGQAALDTYTEWKSVYVDYSGRLQRAQIDNQ